MRPQHDPFPTDRQTAHRDNRAHTVHDVLNRVCIYLAESHRKADARGHGDGSRISRCLRFRSALVTRGGRGGRVSHGGASARVPKTRAQTI